MQTKCRKQSRRHCVKRKKHKRSMLRLLPGTQGTTALLPRREVSPFQPNFSQRKETNCPRKGKRLIVAVQGRKWHLIHLPVCDAGQRQLFQRSEVWAKRAVPPAPSAVVPTSTGTAGPQHRSPAAAHRQATANPRLGRKCRTPS